MNRQKEEKETGKPVIFAKPVKTETPKCFEGDCCFNSQSS